ncbi:hypothetical protein ACCC68_10390 [Tenacibaculum maritimum]|uniref:hypothetical protein n=1 Tax=Tenacibaculum maritimum TaxID=107401 RepID=UPI00352B527C
MKKYILLTLLVLLFNCKFKKRADINSLTLDKSLITEDSLIVLNKKAKDFFINEFIDKAKKIDISETLEPNGGGDFIKDDKTVFIEVLEDMETKEKKIEYTTSFYDKDFRVSNTFIIYKDSLNKAFFVVEKRTKYDTKDESETVSYIDTFLLKKSETIYLKNQDFSQKELLLKQEKLISTIKEIDSFTSD